MVVLQSNFTESQLVDLALEDEPTVKPVSLTQKTVKRVSALSLKEILSRF